MSMHTKQRRRMQGKCIDCERKSKRSRCKPCAERHAIKQRLYMNSRPLVDYKREPLLPITQMLTLAAKIGPKSSLSYSDIYGRKEVIA